MKLQSDQKRVSLEMIRDLIAKLLINLSVSYETLSFYFRIFPIATLLPSDCNTRNTKW